MVYRRRVDITGTHRLATVKTSGKILAGGRCYSYPEGLLRRLRPTNRALSKSRIGSGSEARSVGRRRSVVSL